jgi:hypothetical protein
VKRLTAIVGAIGLLLLSGCSTSDTAVSVGKTNVAVSSIEKEVKSILNERAKVNTSGMNLTTGLKLSQEVVRFHVISILIGDVGTKYKISPTPAEVAKQRAALIAQVGGASGLPAALVNANIAPEDFDLYVKTTMISTALGNLATSAGVDNTNGAAIQSLVVGTAKKEGVVINKRYGQWDAANANVVDATTNSAVVSK